MLSLGAVALFSLLGQLLIIFSLFMNENRKTFIIKTIGLLFLWLAFYYLSHNLFTDTISIVSFFSGTPFLVFSILLGYKNIKSLVF
jgi:hypothetical protein